MTFDELVQQGALAAVVDGGPPMVLEHAIAIPGQTLLFTGMWWDDFVKWPYLGDSVASFGYEPQVYGPDAFMIRHPDYQVVIRAPDDSDVDVDEAEAIRTVRRMRDLSRDGYLAGCDRFITAIGIEPLAAAMRVHRDRIAALPAIDHRSEMKRRNLDQRPVLTAVLYDYEGRPVDAVALDDMGNGAAAVGSKDAAWVVSSWPPSVRGMPGWPPSSPSPVRDLHGFAAWLQSLRPVNLGEWRNVKVAPQRGSVDEVAALSLPATV